jgi:hypothetical protein
MKAHSRAATGSPARFQTRDGSGQGQATQSASVSLYAPIRIASTLNLREHWSARHRRSAQQRRAIALHLLAVGGYDRPGLPVRVTLTRIAPRSLDTDNLAGGFKAVRDEVARWLGVDDADPRVEWAYGQERGKAREYAVRVEIGRP